MAMKIQFREETSFVMKFCFVPKFTIYILLNERILCADVSIVMLRVYFGLRIHCNRNNTTQSSALINVLSMKKIFINHINGVMQFICAAFNDFQKDTRKCTNNAVKWMLINDALDFF
jgi:hypothetical protein